MLDRLDGFVLVSNLVWMEWREERICITAYRERGLERVSG